MMVRTSRRDTARPREHLVHADVQETTLGSLQSLGWDGLREIGCPRSD